MLSSAKSSDLLQSSYSISAPVIVVAWATISWSATLVHLVTDTEYCLVLQSFFLIVLFYFLLILAVYSLGEVDVILSTPLIFSFAPYLPFLSLTFLWT